MKIGIDTRELKKTKAGKGWYVFNVLKEILNIDDKNEYVLYGDEKTEFPNWPMTKNITIKGAEILWHLKVAGRLKRDGVKLYWAPTSPIVPAIAKIPTVMTIMDLTTILFPDKHMLKGRLIDKFFLKRAIGKTKKILCISRATEKDLLKYAPGAKGKTEVIYLGYDQSFRKLGNGAVEGLLDKYKIKPGYILSVGTLEPRKNLTMLIESYSLLDKKLQDLHPLVIVGKKGWLYEEIFKTVEDNGLQKKVKFLKYLPSSDLPSIYNGASLFVYPSLYEGFGLPPLEAMACGLPVIASNVSSLPEVVGGAGILVDPADRKKLTSKITEVLNNESLRTELRYKSLIQAQKFSWAKTAKKTLEILNLPTNLVR